jgi:hypothetical protein
MEPREAKAMSKDEQEKMARREARDEERRRRLERKEMRHILRDSQGHAKKPPSVKETACLPLLCLLAFLCWSLPSFLAFLVRLQSSITRFLDFTWANRSS